MAETDNGILLASYSAARTEILLRMRLRDQILLTYFVVTGALFGIALDGDWKNSRILLALPFLSLAAMALITQHKIVADRLGEFCSEELGSWFKQGRKEVPQWDASQAFRSYTLTSSWFRVGANVLILLIPCVAALSANFQDAVDWVFPFSVVWVFGALCLIVTVCIILYGLSQRRTRRHSLAATPR